MVSTCMDCVGMWRECHGEARALKYIFQVFSAVIPFSMAKEKKTVEGKVILDGQGSTGENNMLFRQPQKTAENNIIFSNF
jgi:hypothetical protein